MTEEEKSALNIQVQEYCQYWIQLLGLQKWIVLAHIADQIDEKIVYNISTGAASIPVITLQQWEEKYPNIPYDMEIALVRDLLKLLFESKKTTLSLYYLARVLVQFKRTVAQQIEK